MLLPILTSIQLTIIEPFIPKPPPAVVVQVTEADNPQHCDENTQWIASEAPFYCIEKSQQDTGSGVALVGYSNNTTDNLYTWGNCTWYVKNLRPELSNDLGNADTWYVRAQAEGFNVGYEPRTHAVAASIYGMHVALVTGVHDGLIDVTEMNVKGLNVISSNTYPASNYRYIY